MGSSAEIPEEETDLLLASYPAALEPQGALALVRPRSAVVVLAEAESPRDLVRLLRPGAWEKVREKELRIHWVAPPRAQREASVDEMDRAASMALAGAALAVVRKPEDPSRMAAEISTSEEAVRWLRNGATTVRSLDLAALDASLPGEELDFRSTPELPRMPDEVDDAEERQRQAHWIRRFHRLGARTFDPAPRLPVRPAVLDSLAATLRGTSPDPFVLAPSQDPEQPIAARGLRSCWTRSSTPWRRPAGTWAPFPGTSSRWWPSPPVSLVERGPGAELESLLSTAGEDLASKLALPDGDALTLGNN